MLFGVQIGPPVSNRFNDLSRRLARNSRAEQQSIIRPPLTAPTPPISPNFWRFARH